MMQLSIDVFMEIQSNGKSSSPVVIRAIVGKGWGQGPQHSKAFIHGLQITRCECCSPIYCL